MSTSRKSHAHDFLLEYLPPGTPQEEHDLVVVVLEAVRRTIARRLGDQSTAAGCGFRDDSC